MLKAERTLSQNALRISGFVLGPLAFAYGMRRRGWSRLALTAAGATLLVETVRREHGFQSAMHRELTVEHVLAVTAEPEQLYRFWKQIEGFPRFMRHLVSVTPLQAGRSKWVARGPLGSTFAWEAERTEDVANRRIAWRSVPGSEVENSGSVEFEPAPGGRGTYVRVTLRYASPAGRIGDKLATLFGENPEQQIREDLRRCRQLLETGEVLTIAGQPSGRRSRLLSFVKSLHGEGQASSAGDEMMRRAR